MDKYKTSTLGQALKKVYRGEITVRDSVGIAENEIREVFSTSFDAVKAPDADTGFFGDHVGVCPLCGGEVIKGRYGYGCKEYKARCQFRINSKICQKIISISNARALLENKKTPKIEGFISKNNKPFAAYLVLGEDGKITFSFDN
jgi:DNA topoisomerase-3